MNILHHIAVAAAYSLIAAAVAIGLPVAFPALDPVAAIVIGGIVLIGSGVVHEIFLRQEGEARVSAKVEAIERQNEGLRDSLANALIEVDALRNSIQTVYSRNASDAEGRRDEVDSVIAEVKVLQGLIEQLSSAQALPQGAVATGTGGALASPPVPPETHESDDLASTQISVVASDGELVSELPGETLLPGRSDDEILQILREGLEANRVDLLLQPIVRLPQRKRTFYEAFTRIRDGAGGTLAPNEYIGIAEREGLVAAIDNFLLFRCVQLVRRTQSLNRNIGFFCNISAHSLMDRHFLGNFVEFMSDNTALAPDLIFEFPHATIVNRDQEVERHLRQLASMGFRFSVDQVPSLNIDYADLAALRFKYVKMNADVLLDEVRAPSAPIAVEDIKRLVDRHGMDLVVEKIETEPDLLELLDLRIDFGQGYLFGSPRLSRQE